LKGKKFKGGRKVICWGERKVTGFLIKTLEGFMEIDLKLFGIVIWGG
jgi:hypothetical protein